VGGLLIYVGGFVEFGVEKQESLTGLLLPFAITYFKFQVSAIGHMLMLWRGFRIDR
jgi:hypothetical protein